MRTRLRGILFDWSLSLVLAGLHTDKGKVIVRNSTGIIPLGFNAVWDDVSMGCLITPCRCPPSGMNY
jgi:hypothetical protein